MWTDFFNQIYLINLSIRQDRLLKTVEQFDDYGIPFKRIEAVHDTEKGARGLRDTMLYIFEDAIKNDYDNILIFEDDVKSVVEKSLFYETMDNAIKQLPINYHLFYLGGQATIGYSHFHAPNLLPALKYFATHAVAYSKQGIKEIMARKMDYPIDNWLVDEIQILGQCYAVHPLLCSQFAGYSNIGMNEIDWNVFIVPRHTQKVNEMRAR